MDYADLGPAMSAAEGRDANRRVKELEKIVAVLSERVTRLEEKVKIQYSMIPQGKDGRYE